MKRYLWGLLAYALVVHAPPACAAAMGDALSCSRPKVSCSPSTATLGDGVEFSYYNLVRFDFAPEGLVVSTGGAQFSLADGASNVYTFQDATQPFTYAKLLGSTMPGINAGKFELNDAGLSVNLRGFMSGSQQSAYISLEEHQSGFVTTGDALTCTRPKVGCRQSNATVGSGAEFDYLGLDFDFSDDLLTISYSGTALYLADGASNVYTFQDTNRAFSFADLAYSSIPGLDASDVSVDGDGLNINLRGLTISNGQLVAIHLSPRVAAAVPEPGSWALMILGLGTAGAMLRAPRREARRPGSARPVRLAG